MQEIQDLTPAAQRLRDAFLRSLADATFDIGRIEYQDAHETRYSFDARPEEVIGPDALANILRSSPEDAGRVLTARTLLVPTVRSDLADALRGIVAPHLKSDSVASALPIPHDLKSLPTITEDRFHKHLNVSSFDHFLKWTLRCAVLLGADRAAQLLDSWATGEPFRYRINVVVSMIIDRKLSPIPGLELLPLPLATDELPAFLPISPGTETRFLGQTLLVAEATVQPAIFRPGQTLAKDLTSRLVCGCSLSAIAHILSLLAGTPVVLGPQWDDYGELGSLIGGRVVLGTAHDLPLSYGPHEIRGSVTTLHPNDHEVSKLDETEIAVALSRVSGTNPRFLTGLSRWCSSQARDADLAARFIDLRIALEALFLDYRPQQEYRFRIPVSAAWLLGRDGPERRCIWKIIRDSYDLASSAVHTGSVQRTNDNLQLLSSAQALCRRALFLFLHHGPVPNWPDIFLGVAAHPAQGPDPDCD